MALLKVSLFFLCLCFAGPAFAQLLSSDELTPAEQIARAREQAAIAERAPGGSFFPDALMERQLKKQRRVSTQGAWSRTGKEKGTVAVYFTLRGGHEDDRLLSVNTPWSAKAELHDSVMDDKGVLRMRSIKELLVSAESELIFSPGGRHIMLIGLKRELRRGMMFPVNLIFEKAGTVRAMVQVRGPSPAELLNQSEAPAPDEADTLKADDHSHHHP